MCKHAEWATCALPSASLSRIYCSYARLPTARVHVKSDRVVIVELSGHDNMGVCDDLIHLLSFIVWFHAYVGVSMPIARILMFRGLHDCRSFIVVAGRLTVGDLVNGAVIANVDVEAVFDHQLVSLHVVLLSSCCTYRSGLWSMVIIESPLTTRCC